jgi:hypothetical protein
MGQRIRQLEDALAIFQSGVSNETHPLLRDNLLSIKFGPEKGYVPEKEPPVRKESLEPPIDAFGAMALGDSGEAKYFGPSAGSEVRAGPSHHDAFFNKFDHSRRSSWYVIRGDI